MRRRALIAGGVAAGALAIVPARVRALDSTGPASAATPPPVRYPSQPIRIVVPQAAGGATDLVARVLGERLEAELRVPVVADNKPGANGIIGTDFVRRASPDGHTLLAATTATHVMAGHVLPDVPFDPQRDFVPVVNVAFQTKVLAVSLAVPAATVAEFVAWARARPDTLNYGSTGIGSASHLDTELFASQAGLALVHIPYRGSQQTVGALVGNEVQVLFASVTAALGAVETGRVRALAILAPQRSPLLPSIPTIAEAGMPLLDVRTWLGLLGPARLPQQVGAQLNEAVNAILRQDAMQAWFRSQGFEVAGGSATQFAALIAADDAKWGRVARALGLRDPARSGAAARRP